MNNKNINFIKIVKKSWNFCAGNFWNFTQIFENSKLLGVPLRHCSKQSSMIIDYTGKGYHVTCQLWKMSMFQPSVIQNNCDSVQQAWRMLPEVAMDPELTPTGFCVFLTDPESKFCEKPDLSPESLFNFGSSRSSCGHFLSKKMGKFRLNR